MGCLHAQLAGPHNVRLAGLPHGACTACELASPGAAGGRRLKAASVETAPRVPKVARIRVAAAAPRLHAERLPALGSWGHWPRSGELRNPRSAVGPSTEGNWGQSCLAFARWVKIWSAGAPTLRRGFCASVPVHQLGG